MWNNFRPVNLKQYDDPYNVYHFPNSIEVVNFLNRGILIPAKVTGENSLESDDLRNNNWRFYKTLSQKDLKFSFYYNQRI